MSPTLLELVIAILLLWLAWQIGVLIAPRLFTSFVSFWRDPPNLSGAARWRPGTKDVTPPPAPAEKQTPPHAPTRE